MPRTRPGPLSPRRRAGLALLLAGIALAGMATAQKPTGATSLVPPVAPAAKPAAAPVTPPPTHALDRADLESWLDGMVPAALEQGQVAGAVVSVVQGDRVLLAKGYGYADMAAKTPMDPATTLVRPGSTSKLFTWTAVMQLAEAGKLDLDADINRYLDFRIPTAPGHPITLKLLMTHRAGFEEGLKDAIVSDPAALQPLDLFLKQHVRPLLFAPGAAPAYSNYGTALAGYIVQRVSGEPFETYVQRHIFAPLDMAHSTFAQPLPKDIGATMSRGYMSSAAPPRPFELISFAPAGSLSSTADDMARFMLAHLHDGAGILKPETARLMHSPLVAQPPGFDTMAHGFFLDRRNGRAVLEHGGDTIVFHSDLQLLPAEQVGLFVSFNSRGEGDAVYGIRERLVAGFLDRYFPGPPPANAPALATAKADGEAIAGRYETSRRVQSGFMSLFYVLQGQEVVGVNPDATISLSSAPGKSFREVAPKLWREVGGDRMIAARTVAGGPALLDSRNPVGVLQPTPLERNAGLNLALFGLSLLVLLGGAIAWAVAEGARRAYRQPPALSGRALLARRLARIATVADLAYLTAWAMVLKPILSSDVGFYTTARDPLIRALQIGGIVPLLGAAAGVWNAALSVRSRRSWLVKTGSVVGALGLIGVAWIAWVGGLLSWTLNY